MARDSTPNENNTRHAHYSQRDWAKLTQETRNHHKKQKTVSNFTPPALAPFFFLHWFGWRCFSRARLSTCHTTVFAFFLLLTVFLAGVVFFFLFFFVRRVLCDRQQRTYQHTQLATIESKLLDFFFADAVTRLFFSGSYFQFFFVFFFLFFVFNREISLLTVLISE